MARSTTRPGVARICGVPADAATPTERLVTPSASRAGPGVGFRGHLGERRCHGRSVGAGEPQGLQPPHGEHDRSDRRDREQRQSRREADLRGHTPHGRPITEDALGGGQRPLPDADVAHSGHVAAEHGLPEQGVEQAEDHRVPGDDREGHEDRGVGDGRKGGGDAVRGAKAPAVVPGDLDRGDDRKHGEDQGSGPGDDQLRPEDGASRDGLGEQIDDRAVVDLRPDHPGADQQADQRKEQQQEDGQDREQQRRAAALIRWASGGEPLNTVNLVNAFALGTLLPLICLLIGTGVIGSEIDDGSIVYLLAKPVPRRTILLSKLVVAWGAALVFAVLPIVAAVEIAGDDGGRLGAAYGVAAALAAITYTAIFVALSVVTRNAVILGLLYALLWETVLGGYVPGVRNVSVRQWALAAAERILGDRATMWGVTSEVSLTAALALLAVATIGAVVLAVRRLQTLRLTSAD